MIHLEIKIKRRKEKIFGSLFEYNENNIKVGQLLFQNSFQKKMYKTFYKNGELKSSVPFLNNKKNGLYKYYYPNGSIKVIIPYRYNIIHGTIKYFNEKGDLIIKSSYKESKKNGKTIHYNRKGEPSIIKMFKNNQLHGKVMLHSEYFYSTLQYKEGKKDGKEKNYIIDINQNKKLYNIINYKNNLREGNTTFFNQDEKRVIIIPYREDKLHGYKKIYNNDGSLKEKIQYRNGNPIYHFLKLVKEKECSICYDSVLTQTKCFHPLCNSCYEKLVDKICPLCRSSLF